MQVYKNGYTMKSLAYIYELHSWEKKRHVLPFPPIQSFNTFLLFTSIKGQYLLLWFSYYNKLYVFFSIAFNNILILIFLIKMTGEIIEYYYPIPSYDVCKRFCAANGSNFMTWNRETEKCDCYDSGIK